MKELSLHRYLGTLFSTKMNPEEKFSLLEKEYGVVDEIMEKEVRDMCNLSDMLVEEGFEKSFEEVEIRMIRMGKSEEEIMDLTDLTKEKLDGLKEELLQKA